MRFLDNIRQLAGKRQQDAAAVEAKKRARLFALIRAGVRVDPKPPAIAEMDLLVTDLKLSDADLDRLAGLFRREAELEGFIAGKAEAEKQMAAAAEQFRQALAAVDAAVVGEHLAGFHQGGDFDLHFQRWQMAHPRRQAAVEPLRGGMLTARKRVAECRQAPVELERLRQQNPEQFGGKGGAR